MKQENDIHKLIKKLHVKASTELDKRVYGDISSSLAKSKKTKSAHVRTVPLIGIGIAAKFAVAAAIIITFGIGFSIGRWSKPTLQQPLDVTSFTSAVSVYPIPPIAEDSFWRQKALAVMQPRPYAQTLTTKTNLFSTYKQYLKEKTI